MSQDHASASWWSPSSVFPAGPGLSSKDTRLVFSAVPPHPTHCLGLGVFLKNSWSAGNLTTNRV